MSYKQGVRPTKDLPPNPPDVLVLPVREPPDDDGGGSGPEWEYSEYRCTNKVGNTYL